MTRARRPADFAVALLLISAAPGMVRSQMSGSLTGVVRDSAGAPVAHAQLSMRGTRATSDSLGRYRLAAVPAGFDTLSVRRVGFAPFASGLDVAGGAERVFDVYLRAVPGVLPQVTTLADSADRIYLADFYRHRDGGTGVFLNRREIEAKKALRTSDILRRLPGMRFVTDRGGRTQLRMSRSNCAPDYWIDGQRAPLLNVDDVPLQDIEALEVYRGESGMPPELNNRGNRECGAVVIWTRPAR
jgi:hypothetical protein